MKDKYPWENKLRSNAHFDGVVGYFDIQYRRIYVNRSDAFLNNDPYDNAYLKQILKFKKTK